MGMATAMPTALSAIVMNDVGPVVETEGLDFIVNYIKEDRPQDDWNAAVDTIKRMLPYLTFQDEAIWLTMEQNTIQQLADGKLHFDWDINIVKPLLKPDYHIPDMWPLFRALARIPTLVLRGSRSDILSRACFEKMQNVKPDLVAIEIPNVGHVPTLSEPESRAALDKFIDQN